jgi:acyl-CoA thioester hydrolase
MTDSAPIRTYTHEVRVRYAEVDRMGCLHHSRYFVLLEEARTEALRAMGLTYRDMEDRGWFIVVANASCRFRVPARYDDVLRIETTVTRITHTRIDHAYRVVRKSDGQLLAEAQTTLACVDWQGDVQAIPEKARALMDS